MDYSASAVYGGAASPQPLTSPVAAPAHAAGTPAPHARTLPMPTGILSSPVFVLVAFLGVAALLVQFSVRGTIELKT